jgi:hypothetical protein
MIGRVTWEEDGVAYEARLREDGSWAAPYPALARLFRAVFSDTYRGPQDGPFGPRQLRAAAEYLGGTSRLEPVTPDPPGRIY